MKVTITAFDEEVVFEDYQNGEVYGNINDILDVLESQGEPKDTLTLTINNARPFLVPVNTEKLSKPRFRDKVCDRIDKMILMHSRQYQGE